jgi:integrase
MARHVRNSGIENRTARLKLPVSSNPRWTNLGSGTGIGYRRTKAAGTWSKRTSDGRGGYTIEVIGTADDYQEADGVNVLNYFQAQRRAIALAGTGGGTDDGKLVTVAGALDRYEDDLKIRSQDIANVARVRVHLPKPLADRTVALLTQRELRHWRDGLTKELEPSTVNRVCTALKAALNLVCGEDDRITNQRAWGKGLAGIPNATVSNNVVISDQAVRAISVHAYTVISEQFGMYVEVAAVTGARPSQITRLLVRDLQDDQPDHPRLMVPASRKGRGQRKVTHRAVPIPKSLAVRLRRAVNGRPDNAWLLTKPNGELWGKNDHARPFRRTVEAAGLDGDTITIYALRHSSITRQLLAGVPIRVIADTHDTSVAMIEKTYSQRLSDHSDAVSRSAMLDLSRPVLLPHTAR